MRKRTQRSKRKTVRKTKRYNYKKKGGSLAPIKNSAKYSYPSYFPNKVIDTIDILPPNKDINIPYNELFPLNEHLIYSTNENNISDINNFKIQSGGYIYDQKLLRKLKQAKNYKHIKGLK